MSTLIKKWYVVRLAVLSLLYCPIVDVDNRDSVLQIMIPFNASFCGRTFSVLWKVVLKIHIVPRGAAQITNPDQMSTHCRLCLGIFATLGLPRHVRLGM